MQFVKPIPFREAVDKIGVKTPIGSVFTSSEWSDVPVALRERAMFSSQVESVRFLQRTQDWISDYLLNNRETLESGDTALAVASRAQFVELAREFAMREGMGPLEPGDEGTLKDITSEARLGLIFDVQTQQAGDYGYWRQGMQADVLNEFPAQRFIRVLDVKEPRLSHRQFEDQVYLKTDPIWAGVINADFGVPWGPWGFGCGHDVLDEDRATAEELGLLQPGEYLEPVPKSFNENLRASAIGLEPELLAKLKAEFGERLIIENGEMRWQEAAPAPAPERSSPVSDAIQLKVAGGLRESVQTALDAIDKVHDDGDLPETEIRNTTRPDFGFVKPKWEDGVMGTEFIAVRSTGPWPSVSTTHEIGHFLDIEAIGEEGRMATRSGDPDMMRVIAAARKTEAIKGLAAQMGATKSADTRDHLEYLLSPEEVWARAYAQFVAERSGNNTLLRELAVARDYEEGRQWRSGDFAPVAAEIENMFRKLGWL